MTVRTSLSWRLLRYRSRRFLTLAGLCAALFASLAVVTGWSASADLARQQSVTAHFAGFPFQVHVNDAAANSVVRSVPGSVPITESVGQISTSSGTVDASIVSLPGGLVPRMIVAGRAPETPSEAVVAQTTAGALGIALGSSVEVSRDDQELVVVVVGISVDPGNRWDDAVVIPSELPGSDSDGLVPTRWLMTTDPVSVQSTETLLRQRAIVGSSRASGIDDLADTTTMIERPLDFLRFVVPGLIGVSAVLLLMVASSLTPVLKRDFDSLRAAGMTSRGAAWTVLLSLALAAVVGLVCGGLFGFALLAVFRNRLSASIDQIWLTVTGQPLLLAASCALWLGAVLFAGHRAVKPTRRDSISGPNTQGLSVVGWVSLGAVFLVFVALHLQFLVGRRLLPFPLSFPVAGLLALLSCWAIYRHSAKVRPSRGALRPAMAAMSGGLVALGAAVALIIVFSTYFAGAQAHNTYGNLEYYQAQQPLGSLVVDDLSASATEQLLHSYTDRGGKDAAVWQILDENESSLRAVSPRSVACLEARGSYDIEEGEECFADPGVYNSLGLVVLNAQNRQQPLEAATELVSDGQVGLLTFPNRDSMTSTSRASAAQVHTATADDALGGRLPTATIGIDDPLVQQLGLQISGTQMVVLPDFGTLSGSDQAFIRARADSLAPTRQSSELLVPEDLDVRRRGLVVAVCASALEVGLIVTTMSALWAAQRNVWLILQSLADRRRRRRLVLLWTLPLTGSVIVGTGLGAWLMWYANPHNGMGFGWEWILPGASAIVATVVMIGLLSRRLNANQV